MTRPLLPLLLLTLAVRADVIIDESSNNGGFASADVSFNGSPADWIAQKGVWVMSVGSSLDTAPFGPDAAADSRAIQIHNDAGETLTSVANFAVVGGETIGLSFDYRIGGSGNNVTLTASLWDTSTNSTYATLGTISSATGQSNFTQIDFATTATTASDNLRLRFVLSSAGGLGKDIHIDRVHLSGGTLVEPPPPAPIDYATAQPLVDGDTSERIVEKAAKTLPRANQVAWQRMETTFFIHFGVNTFNGTEWGTGTENPNVFNPTALDASQWVREIKAAGGKQVVLVAKHHDGFCLWPSRYTTQDVASSSWLGGAGDVLRAISDACQTQGLKLGIYLSPADLFQIHARDTPGYTEGYYGNNSAAVASVIPTDPASFKSDPSVGRTPPEGRDSYTYTVDDYNRYFYNQLYELLTEYGPIHQMWFDGANPEAGTTQTYDYPGWYDMIRKLQPGIVLGIGGPDARWVGNENGVARTSEWSVLPFSADPINGGAWLTTSGSDLGSRSKLTIGSVLSWYPAEADVPILNGWFWNASKTPKSVSSLIDIYYSSVGRNANLLLNLSPDNRGLIPDGQLSSLRALSQVVGQTFGTNLAAGASVSADSSSDVQPAALAADGDLDTWWEPAAGVTTPTFTLSLPAAVTFDVISLQEAIATRSQRIESFAVDSWNGSSWVEQATATTVGQKRLVRLASPVTSDQVRVRILQSRLEPSLAEISLHLQADLVAEPSIARSVAGDVTLSAGSGETIRYTIDGSEPTASSAAYTGAIPLVLGGTVRAMAFRSNGSHSLPATKVFGIAPSGWSATADTAQGGNPASFAIDGDPSTFWHTAWDGSGESTPQPHWITIDMGDARWIRGFSYLPRQDGGNNGTIRSYRCETSGDGSTWTIASEASFANILNNPIEQTVEFAEPVNARFLRFTSIEEVNSRTFASAAELSVLPGGFDDWRVRKGLQNETSDADTDGDGRPNWQEYAQGSDPFVRDHTSPVIEWLNSQAKPGLIFKRPAGLVDVGCDLQAVGKLDDLWQDVAADVSVVSTESDGTQFLRYEETNPPVPAPRRFYRLHYRLD